MISPPPNFSSTRDDAEASASRRNARYGRLPYERNAGLVPEGSPFDKDEADVCPTS